MCLLNLGENICNKQSTNTQHNTHHHPTTNIQQQMKQTNKKPVNNDNKCEGVGGGWFYHLNILLCYSNLNCTHSQCPAMICHHELCKINVNKKK